jgi:ABC-type methionine transport system permease subunit
MQQKDIIWLDFGWTLAVAFLFGVLFALLVHWASKRQMVGQTAWAVVVGVAVTLLTMIPMFGLDLVALISCYFAATGIPMIVEYILRIQSDIQRDKEEAKGLAKDLVK